MEVDRETMIDIYIEYLKVWGIQIDHEDGSTAPFTSLALEDLCHFQS